MNRVKNCVFLVRKWSYTTFTIINIRKMWEKKGKIRRTRSMTKKKRSSEIFTLKMEIFPEIGPRKNVLVPPKFGARSPPMLASMRYASPAWWGFTTVQDRDRIEKLMSRLRRGGYLRPGQPSYEELAGKADERLLKSIMTNPSHVLSKYLPKMKNTGHNLRPMAYGYELPPKDDLNCIPGVTGRTPQAPGLTPMQII